MPNLRPPYAGQDFIRLVKAMAIGAQASDEGASYAKSTMGENSLAHRILSSGGLQQVITLGSEEKAAVPAGATATGNWARLLVDFEGAAAEFFRLVRERSLIGKIGNLRRVPLQTRLVSTVNGFSAAWVGEGKAIPVGQASFADETLPRRKVTSLAVLTEEHLRAADPAAELLIRDEMLGAITTAINATFIDPANAGVPDVEPASITYGAPSDATTGTSDTDDIRSAIAFAIANFGGDLEQAVWVGRPELFAYLGMNSPLQMEAIGARGGSIGGIPAVPSKDLPLDGAGKQQLALIDPTGIAYGEDGMDVRTSREATIEMKNDPSGDALAPTATTAVSLWQCNSFAILATNYLNFERVRAGSVRVITGLEGGIAS